MSSFVEVVAGSLGIFDPLGKGIGLAGHLVGHREHRELRELRDRRVLRAYRDFRQRGRGRGGCHPIRWPRNVEKSQGLRRSLDESLIVSTVFMPPSDDGVAAIRPPFSNS